MSGSQEGRNRALSYFATASPSEGKLSPTVLSALNCVWKMRCASFLLCNCWKHTFPQWTSWPSSPPGCTEIGPYYKIFKYYIFERLERHSATVVKADVRHFQHLYCKKIINQGSYTFLYIDQQRIGWDTDKDELLSQTNCCIDSSLSLK